MFWFFGVGWGTHRARFHFPVRPGKLPRQPMNIARSIAYPLTRASPFFIHCDYVELHPLEVLIS